MAQSERLEFEMLKRRVANLEARLAARPQPPHPLARRNATRQADARRLDEAIAAMLCDHPRADELSARQICEALRRDGFEPLPAERTIRSHRAAIRGIGNTV